MRVKLQGLFRPLFFVGFPIVKAEQLSLKMWHLLSHKLTLWCVVEGGHTALRKLVFRKNVVLSSNNFCLDPGLGPAAWRSFRPGLANQVFQQLCQYQPLLLVGKNCRISETVLNFSSSSANVSVFKAVAHMYYAELESPC